MGVSQHCPRGHEASADETICPICGTLLMTATMAPPPAPPPPPDVPGYRIDEELGRGGMGVVYRAEQLALGRAVALKMIRSGALAGTAEVERFHIEALALARAQHAHIIQIFEVGQCAGQPYLALEYVAGGTLADRLAGKPQPPRAAAALVELLARAVQHAHECGIVHRDLKPANVLLTATGEPKVTDFGLARRLDGIGQTQPGALMGTPSYMSPEQARGLAASTAADVYALGAILYELLTGRPPFLGEGVADTLRQVVEHDPVTPRRLQASVPRDLETVCLKCLEKEPARRYGTAAALADDLHRYLDGQSVVARPAGLVRKSWLWCRRRPAQALLAAALVLAIVTGMIGISWQAYEAARARDHALTARDDAERERAGFETLAETYRLLGQGATTQAVTMESARQRQQRMLTALADARDHLATLIRDHPTHRLRGHLAEVHTALAVLNATQGKSKDARTEADRARELLAQGDTTAKASRLGDRAFVLGALYMNLKAPAEARQLFSRAVEHHRQALDEAPNDTGRRKALSIAYYHLGEMQRRTKQLDEAAASARVRAELWPNEPDEVYDAACELARAMPLATKDAAQRYGTDAMRLLRQAVARGLRDPLAMDRDADLRPLRQRADYQELLRELRKKTSE